VSLIIQLKKCLNDNFIKNIDDGNDICIDYNKYEACVFNLMFTYILAKIFIKERT
jgi:hypothetical protein